MKLPWRKKDAQLGKALWENAEEAQRRWTEWNTWIIEQRESQIPHCDPRILHTTQECEYCAKPKLQKKRRELGIAWTGHGPTADQVQCEADAKRPPQSEADHRRWGGNKPTTSIGDASWPQETGASLAFYGDMGGRA